MSEKVSIEERARRYVAAMEASVAGNNGHTALFNVVRALLHGFGFSAGEAQGYVQEFNLRCDPPWSESEILHKLRSVDGLTSKWPRGYLRREEDWRPSRGQRAALGIPTEAEVRKKVEFEADKLRRVAGPWRDVVDAVWLANRSAVDPAGLSASDFLKMLYGANDKVLVFTNEYSQGDALWPVEAPPSGGRVGVWFLPQPVTGEFLPNPEGKPTADGKGPVSRRTWRSVTDFRYFVIESDEAPLRDWLGFIVQAPLRIEALYTSGGRSVHALVRVDAPTKEAWDEQKRRLMPFLLAAQMCGADRGTWSAVRLSRLPGCLRKGKAVAERGGDGEKTGRTIYRAYNPPAEQKLLYVRPGAQCRPICELPALRDVEEHWTGLAALGVSDADESGGALVRRGLSHYARVSERCRVALAAWEAALRE